MLNTQIWSKNYIFVICTSFLLFLGFYLVMPSLPIYVKSLGFSQGAVGLVTGIFTLSAVACRPIMGRLLDTKGRKGVFFFGALIIILATITYPLFSSIILIVFVRLIHGVGWSAATTATGTIATDNIPKERLSEGMGYYAMTAVAAMAIAPAMALTLLNHVGFSGICAISIFLGVVAGLMGIVLRVHQVDRTIIRQQEKLYERQALLPAIVMLLVNLTYGAINTFIAIYALQNDIKNVGPFFTIYAVSLLLTRPLLGKSVDRKGHQIAMLPGLLCFMIGLLCLVFASTLTLFLLSGMFIGIGFGAIHPTLQAISVKGVPAHRRGAANSTFMCGFDIGVGLGAIACGLIGNVCGLRMMYALNLIPILFALGIYLVLWSKESRIEKTS